MSKIFCKFFLGTFRLYQIFPRDIAFSGDDSFTYTIDDGKGGTSSSTVSVSVSEQEDNSDDDGDSGG